MTIPTPQTATWIGDAIEAAAREMPLDAGAEWIVGWLLAYSDLSPERAEEILERCASRRRY